MQLLKKRILQDGKCYEGGILKVDGFINHQMDPVLMKSIGVEFVRRFAATNVNKIMTIGRNYRRKIGQVFDGTSFYAAIYERGCGN